MSQEEIRKDVETVIQRFNNNGVKLNEIPEDLDREGLGDLAEQIFNKLGWTEERWKAMWGLKECGCSRRKKWLNKIMSWKKRS